MAARSPISLEVIQLQGRLNHEPNSREVRNRWNEIWRDLVAAGGLEITDPWFARDVLLLGRWIATQDGRFRDAADLLSLFFEHPQAEELGPSWLLYLRCLVVSSLLDAGDEHEALSVLRSMIESPQKGTARTALCFARNALWWSCSEQRGTDRASEGLTELVREIDHRLRRRKVRRWLPGRATYVELCELLLSTYPAEERELIRAREPESIDSGRPRHHES